MIGAVRVQLIDAVNALGHLEVALAQLGPQSPARGQNRPGPNLHAPPRCVLSEELERSGILDGEKPQMPRAARHTGGIEREPDPLPGARFQSFDDIIDCARAYSRLNREEERNG